MVEDLFETWPRTDAELEAIMLLLTILFRRVSGVVLPVAVVMTSVTTAAGLLSFSVASSP